MDPLFVLLASLSAVAVIFMLFRRRTQSFQQIINKLERQNAQLNLQLSRLSDEEGRLNDSLDALDSQIKMAALQATEHLDAPEEQKAGMRFLDYLVHRGGITSDQLKKVERYKVQTGSPMSAEELLIVLDMLSREKLQSMKEAFGRLSDGSSGAGKY